MTARAFINGTTYTIQANESLLEFCKRNGYTIPTLCDDSNLEPYGACRVCSVDVALSADGPLKVVASCHTPVSDGMHVTTESKRVLKLRRNIIELVLTDHPLDCLTCEVNGNCQLQDVAASTGVREVRYPDGTNHLNYEKDPSHPYMRSELSKCINCYRCVRACDEIQGEFILDVAGRGFASRIIKGTDQSFNDSDCVSCGACAQTCPTSAISDLFQSKSNEATQTTRTICSYCGVGCNLLVSTRGGEILSIQGAGDAKVNAGHTCLKGRYAFRFYKHPDRLNSPLIRKNGELATATWDEAYAYIGEKLSQIKHTHGADAIAGISSARCTNEENYLMQKMMRVVIGTNNIDSCARVCHSPTAYGMQQSFGTGAATNSIADLQQATLMMIIGANPTAAHPVTGVKIKQRSMKGIPLIVIDPVVTEVARYANWHLQLRPGTNVALLDMMAYFIIEAKLIDQQFIDSRCEAFNDYRTAILTLDIDALELATGVKQSLVKDAALAYANAERAMSFHGLGVTEHQQGSRAIMSIANLAMMTGNIGKPGVGVNPLRGQNNVQGAADMGCQPHQGAGYLPIDSAESKKYYDAFYGTDTPPNIGLKIPEMYQAAQKGTLKALWIMGEDLAQSDPNHHYVVDSLKKLDLLVVQEIFLSETAKLADVVLPGASFLEKNGTFTNGERRIQRVNAAVDIHQGCKSDGQIIVDAMNQLGYAQADYDAAKLLEEIAQLIPFFSGVRWERLGDNGLQWPVAENGEDCEILHIKSFKRDKGKFHFFAYEESHEVSDNKEKFPYILTTSRHLVHYNAGTMTRRTANQQIISEDVLLINPCDAADKKITNGSSVRLFSARGEVILSVEISQQVEPGILFTTFHFPEFMVNCITGDGHDEQTLCPEYKVVSVDFENLSEDVA